MDDDTRPGEVDATYEHDESDAICFPVQSRSDDADRNPRVRQCVVEEINLDNVRQIQTQNFAEIEQIIGQNLERTCMDEVQRLLAEIRGDLARNNLVDAISKIKELQETNTEKNEFKYI